MSTLGMFRRPRGQPSSISTAVCVVLASPACVPESIFLAVLERLEVAPEEAAMVGDSPEDDIEGAAALGIRAFLLDRENRFPDYEGRLPDLYALPAALGLKRPAA